jgi:hypothetical protein
VGLLDIVVILILAAAAVYLLAILLRVSCHFCGVEIPALGRAYFTAFAATSLTVVVVVALQGLFVGFGVGRVDLILQFAVVMLGLAAHMAIAVTVYALALGMRAGKAFSVWLMQALVFSGFAVLLGCCFGGVSLL